MNGDLIASIAGLSLATACISFSISEMKLFLPVRESVKRFSQPIGELLSCGYCLGHWVSAILVCTVLPQVFPTFWLIDKALSTFIVAWLAAFQWIIMCLLMDRAGK